MFQYTARLVRVIDGDTAELTVDLGFEIDLTTIVRFYGIDTPERGQAGFTEATDFVKAWFAGRESFTINTYKKDKYGRYLAEMLDGNTTLNKMLVDSNLARVYLP